MEQESAGGCGVFLQNLPEGFVSPYTMDGDDHISFRGDFQLADEDPLLILDVVPLDPAVEPGFADAGFRMAVKECG